MPTLHILNTGYVGERVASTVVLIETTDALVVVDPGMVAATSLILDPLAKCPGARSLGDLSQRRVDVPGRGGVRGCRRHHFVGDPGAHPAGHHDDRGDPRGHGSADPSLVASRGATR